MEDKLQKLLAANGPALLRLAASYTRNQSDRDDLFQEISLAIWKALPSFRGNSSERTFMFRIATTAECPISESRSFTRYPMSRIRSWILSR